MMTLASEHAFFLVDPTECPRLVYRGTEMELSSWIVTFHRIPHEPAQRLVLMPFSTTSRPCVQNPIPVIGVDTDVPCPGRLRTSL